MHLLTRPTMMPHNSHAFRSLTLSLAVLAALGVRATIRTVSNNTNSPAQYTSIATAITAAANGDTILVTGSPISYGSPSINKQLTLIGAGHNNGGPSSQFDNVFFTTGSSNTVMIGFYCPNTVSLNNYTDVINGLRIERCRVANMLTSVYNTPSHNLTVRNCIVTGNITLGPGSNNVLITNNLIRGTLSVSSPTNMVISHNLFFNTAAGDAMTNISAAIISDNIFWGRTPVHASLNNCVFNNNITYQTSNDVIPFGTNTGTGNLTGVNPMFVNAPDRSGNLTYDYNLQSGSPGHNAGVDGTDIGVFGGISAFIDLTGRARIPLVTTLTILNSSIGQGGSLNVVFSGTKVD